MNDARTLEYYNQNTDTFFQGTVEADMEYARTRFLHFLEPKACILDFGCGSGRDTKAFLDLGYSVEATDGSEELCVRASEYTGIPVKKLFFQDLDAKEQYDGIWACASILHLPKQELYDVFLKMIRALKESGILYTSFKYGTFEGYRKERYFTDFTEQTLTEFLKPIKELTLLEHWISKDVRPERKEEKWLNIILQK